MLFFSPPIESIWDNGEIQQPNWFNLSVNVSYILQTDFFELELHSAYDIIMLFAHFHFAIMDTDLF